MPSATAQRAVTGGVAGPPFLARVSISELGEPPLVLTVPFGAQSVPKGDRHMISFTFPAQEAERLWLLAPPDAACQVLVELLGAPVHKFEYRNLPALEVPSQSPSLAGRWYQLNALDDAVVVQLKLSLRVSQSVHSVLRVVIHISMAGMSAAVDAASAAREARRAAAAPVAVAAKAEPVTDLDKAIAI